MASLSGPLRKAAPGAGYRREGRATRRQAQPSGVRAQLHHNASAPHVNRCFLPFAPTHTASHSHTHTNTHAVVSLQVEPGAGGRAEPASAPAALATHRPPPRRSACCRKLQAGWLPLPYAKLSSSLSEKKNDNNKVLLLTSGSGFISFEHVNGGPTVLPSVPTMV